MLFVLVGIVSVLDVNAEEPFYFDTKGVVVQDYQLDFEVMSVILDVQVTESIGTVETTFDREFFDSVYQNQDDEFLIIENGDLLPYTETKTTPETRTLMFFLDSEVEEVEIFGTHLQGQTLENQIEAIVNENEINSKTSKEPNLLVENKQLATQVDQLENQIVQLNEENKVLQDENEELGNKIFEFENLVSAMKEKISYLNAIVFEQINIITAWFNSQQ